MDVVNKFVSHYVPKYLILFDRLLHVRNGNCKYHLGEETFKQAQSYMDKLAKCGHQANKAALYGELCALLFAKSHYDEVKYPRTTLDSCLENSCSQLLS